MQSGVSEEVAMVGDTNLFLGEEGQAEAEIMIAEVGSWLTGGVCAVYEYSVYCNAVNG